MDYSRWMKMPITASAIMPQAPAFRKLPEGVLPWDSEPYYLAKRASLPLYDEHFFCQQDKLQQVLMTSRCAKFRFYVMADLFVMELPNHLDSIPDS